MYSYWLFITALEAVLLRRELGPRVDLVVSRAHRYDILKEANALGFLPQRRLLAEGLDRVYPVSDSGRASLLDDVGDLAGKVTVRRLGVAPPSAIGPRSNRPLLEVVSCSSLKPVKRVPLIVESLAALHARGIPFRWTHFGGNGPEFAHLARNAERVLPPGSFRLAGHLPNADVLAHYAARPVTLFPQRIVLRGRPGVHHGGDGARNPGSRYSGGRYRPAGKPRSRRVGAPCERGRLGGGRRSRVNLGVDSRPVRPLRQ